MIAFITPPGTAREFPLPDAIDRAGRWMYLRYWRDNRDLAHKLNQSLKPIHAGGVVKWSIDTRTESVVVTEIIGE